MTVLKAIVTIILAVSLSACGSAPKVPVTPQGAMQPPADQASAAMRRPGPETTMSFKVQPREPGLVPPLPPATADSPPPPGQERVVDIDTGKKPADKEAAEKLKASFPKHMGNPKTGLIGPSTAERRHAPTAEDKEKLKVRFTFDKAEVAEVSNQLFDDFLKVNYVLDPALQGRISFYIEGEFTRDELFQMIFKAYEANNISVTPRGGIYYIQSLQKSSNASLALAGPAALQEKNGIKPVIVMYRLRYMDPKQAVNTLKPFITPGRLLTADAMTSSVIFVEDSENAKSIVELLKALDVNVLQEVSMEIVPVMGMTPDDAAKGMENLVGKLDVFKQSSMKGGLAFIPLPSFGGLLILAQNPEVLKTAKFWLQALDVHGQEAGEQIHVYFVQNGLATDIAGIIGQVFNISTGSGGGPGQRVVGSTTGGSTFGSGGGGGGTFGGGGSFGSSSMGALGGSSSFGGSSSSFGSSLGGSANTTGAAGAGGLSNTAARSGGRLGGGVAGPRTSVRGAGNLGGAGGLSGEPIIIPDEVNNAIVTRANASDWAKIKKTIETLDITPRAVLIEVLVAEVSLTKDMSYGLEWFFNGIGTNILGKNGTLTAGHGGAGVFGTDSSGNSTALDPTALVATHGLNLFWGSIDKKIGALLQLLSTKTEVNVLTHPTLLATDNKEAAIHIGGREPIPTGSVTGASTGGTDVVNTIQYAETGLILNVIPHINAGGLVRLEVEQDIIATTDTPATVGVDNTAPRFTERNIKTTLLSQDGSTVVIGGIIQQTQNKNKTGIPYLNEVPIIAPLFGSTSDHKAKTEILIAITPHVVNQRESGCTREFIDALKRLTNKAQGGQCN